MRRLDALLRAAAAYDAGDPKRIQHFLKVHAFVRLIGEAEGLDDETLETLEAAAVVHDIGIHNAEKNHGSAAGKWQELEGPPVARELLRQAGFAPAATERACWLVGHHHSYGAVEETDHRILIEADFLVNLYEDGVGEEAVHSAYERVFRTQTGRWLCRTMYLTPRD